jgi:hypothetical protein
MPASPVACSILEESNYCRVLTWLRSLTAAVQSSAVTQGRRLSYEAGPSNCKVQWQVAPQTLYDSRSLEADMPHGDRRDMP